MNRQAFSQNLRTRGKSHHRVLVDLGYTHSTADRLRIPNPLEVKKNKKNFFKGDGFYLDTLHKINPRNLRVIPLKEASLSGCRVVLLSHLHNKHHLQFYNDEFHTRSMTLVDLQSAVKSDRPVDSVSEYM